MADVVALAVEELKKRGAEDAAALATRAVSGEADGTELIEKEEAVPTWRQRDYSSVSVGTPYKWQEQVYKLWQQHDASPTRRFPSGMSATPWTLTGLRNMWRPRAAGACTRRGSAAATADRFTVPSLTPIPGPPTPIPRAGRR